jgi:hypothetical protein
MELEMFAAEVLKLLDPLKVLHSSKGCVRLSGTMGATYLSQQILNKSVEPLTLLDNIRRIAEYFVREDCDADASVNREDRYSEYVNILTSSVVDTTLNSFLWSLKPRFGIFDDLKSQYGTFSLDSFVTQHSYLKNPHPSDLEDWEDQFRCDFLTATAYLNKIPAASVVDYWFSRSFKYNQTNRSILFGRADGAMGCKSIEAAAMVGNHAFIEAVIPQFSSEYASIWASVLTPASRAGQLETVKLALKKGAEWSPLQPVHKSKIRLQEPGHREVRSYLL